MVPQFEATSICGLSSWVKYAGCDHGNKTCQSSLPIPDSLFCYWILFWVSGTPDAANQMPIMDRATAVCWCLHGTIDWSGLGRATRQCQGDVLQNQVSWLFGPSTISKVKFHIMRDIIWNFTIVSAHCIFNNSFKLYSLKVLEIQFQLTS